MEVAPSAGASGASYGGAAKIASDLVRGADGGSYNADSVARAGGHGGGHDARGAAGAARSGK